jgi:hypothetical protein
MSHAPCRAPLDERTLELIAVDDQGSRVLGEYTCNRTARDA